jgi:hypothetical protein
MTGKVQGKLIRILFMFLLLPGLLLRPVPVYAQDATPPENPILEAPTPETATTAQEIPTEPNGETQAVTAEEIQLEVPSEASRTLLTESDELLATPQLADDTALPEGETFVIPDNITFVDESGDENPLGSQESADILSAVPLSFIEEIGQTGQAVEFYTSKPGEGLIGFAKNEIVIQIPDSDEFVVVRFLDANPAVVIEAGEQLEGVVNYYFGDNPENYFTGLTTYRDITYHNLWNGIDLSYTGDREGLKSTYTVAAGVNPGLIQWQYDHSTLAVDEQGRLRVSTLDGDGNLKAEIIEDTPIAWQEDSSGARVIVDAQYQISDNLVSYLLGSYDPGQSLVIDPITQVLGTYYGDYGAGSISSIFTDSNNNMILTGNDSLGYYVTKMNEAGSSVAYTTHLSVSPTIGIKVDSSDNVYMAGHARGGQLAITANATFNVNNSGEIEGFLTKLSPTGSLLYSSYTTNNIQSSVSALELDNMGNVFIGGFYRWPNLNGGYISKIDTTQGLAANTLKYYKNLVGSNRAPGGEGWTVPTGLDLDDSGNLHVAGNTDYTNLPGIGNGGWDTTYNGGGEDIFYLVIDPNGNTLRGTYLGGYGTDSTRAMVFDDLTGNAYILADTQSDNAPVTANALDSSYHGNVDYLLYGIGNHGGTLNYGTYLGGSGTEYIWPQIAVDNDYIYACFPTSSDNLLTTPNAFDRTYNGGRDGYLSVINKSNGQLAYGTYMGGAGDDGFGFTIDDRFIYTTLLTATPGLPATANAMHSTSNGSWDNFMTILDKNTWDIRLASYVGAPLITNPLGDGLYFVGGTTTILPTTLGAYDRTLVGSKGAILKYALHLNPPSALLRNTDDLAGLPTQGTVVANLNTLDPDIAYGDTHTYALVAGMGSTDNNLFTIGGDQLRADASFDRRSKEYSIRVRVTDSDGYTYEEVLTYPQLHDPEDLILSSEDTDGIEINGSNIADLEVVDPDTALGETFTFSFAQGPGDADNGLFNVVGNQLLAGQAIDRREQEISIRLKVTDSHGFSYEKVVVYPQLHDPEDLILSSDDTNGLEISGNTIAGLEAIDQDKSLGETFTYALVSGAGDADNDLFNIVGDRLFAAQAIDRRDHEISIRLKVTDSHGFSYEEVVRYPQLHDPEDIILSTDHTPGLVLKDSNIADLEAVDQDQSIGETFTYALVSGAGDADNGLFSIVGDQLFAGQGFDRRDEEISIRLKVTDSHGFSYEEVVRYPRLYDPSDILIDNDQIDFTQLIGSLVGNLTGVDLDGAENLTYALVSGEGDIDNFLFSLQGRQIILNQEAQQGEKLSVRVQVTDPYGFTFEKVIIFTVRAAPVSPSSDENDETNGTPPTPIVLPVALPADKPVRESKEPFVGILASKDSPDPVVTLRQPFPPGRTPPFAIHLMPWLWPFAGLPLLCLGLGIARVTDRRYQEIACLRTTLEIIQKSRDSTA